jgi:hypothetical protein
VQALPLLLFLPKLWHCSSVATIFKVFQTSTKKPSLALPLKLLAIIIQNDRFADVSDVVDIYNGVTDTWTTAVLSSARYLLSAVSLPAQGLLVFAGGQTTTGASSRIDIFIGSTGLWATDELSSPRRSVAGTFLSNENVVILAGGFSDSGNSLFRSLCFVPC